MSFIKLSIGLIAALLFGCAATYEQPKTAASPHGIAHKSSKPDVIEKAKQLLVERGYVLQMVDEKAGLISTSPKFARLTKAQADCGTTMGLDYLNDNRTTTTVAINITVDTETITVRSNIHGEYKPGSVDQNLTLVCNSSGKIEASIADAILNYK